MQLINDFFRIVSHDADAYTVRFNPAHVIYQAHFPGNPVTPGVCIIQTVTEVLEQHLQGGVRLMLDEVKNIKFIIPISPVDTPQATIRFDLIQCSDGQCKARGTVTAGDDDKIYTKFSLHYRLTSSPS